MLRSISKLVFEILLSLIATVVGANIANQHLGVASTARPAIADAASAGDAKERVSAANYREGSGSPVREAAAPSLGTAATAAKSTPGLETDNSRKRQFREAFARSATSKRRKPGRKKASATSMLNRTCADAPKPAHDAAIEPIAKAAATVIKLQDFAPK
jgi:hypothetical protein